MFSVPGWSVPSSTLKKQTSSSSKSTANQTAPAKDVGLEGSEKAGKKRKRSSGASKASDVNSTNLADLWETVIEKKTKHKQDEATDKRTEKQHKAVTDGKNKGTVQGEDDSLMANDSSVKNDILKDYTNISDHTEQRAEKAKKQKTLKDKKREKKARLNFNGDGPEQISNKSREEKTPALPVSVSKPIAKLTALQAAMRQKLVSARFRHLNQTLYTTPSSHSLNLFQQNPEMFQEYHEGFRRQVEVWPENPVDTFIAQIRARGSQRGQVRNSSKPSEAAHGSTTATGLVPLPRTEGTCYIADLGCGDAALSQGLEKEKKKLKVQVFSYDLQNPSSLVTKADIANLPLKDGSIDVAIFCLALMGTNWVDFIEEAFRVLRWKGELWVAEIKSRFGRVSGKGKRVDHSVGNRKKPGKKAAKRMDEDADNADLLVEVDGLEDTKGETDVSAFVEVLRKRGFVLRSERAVDLSNKMFVKMSFMKGMTPIKGKCVPVPKGMAEMGLDTWRNKAKPKFLDDEEDMPVSSEGSVLKPCVYKLR